MDTEFEKEKSHLIGLLKQHLNRTLTICKYNRDEELPQTHCENFGLIDCDITIVVPEQERRCLLLEYRDKNGTLYFTPEGASEVCPYHDPLKLNQCKREGIFQIEKIPSHVQKGESF